MRKIIIFLFLLLAVLPFSQALFGVGCTNQGQGADAKVIDTKRMILTK